MYIVIKNPSVIGQALCADVIAGLVMTEIRTIGIKIPFADRMKQIYRNSWTVVINAYRF